MTYTNKTILNFSGGEISPELYARTDLPINGKCLKRCQNFIPHATGPARYRSGTRYEFHTRNNNYGRFIDFQFSDVQAYEVELTEGYMRFHKDGAPILDSNNVLTITGITKASPGVLTYTGTDPSNGQEVYLTGISGMTELNGRYAIVANVDTGANTFQLKDVFGNNINTTQFGTYTAGGTATPIYEIRTPYQEEDLDEIFYAQNADTMYLMHRYYEQRTLTRSAHDSWALARYARTADPFRSASSITGVTQANPAVVTYSGADNFANGDIVYIDSIVGMTELNYGFYKVANVNTAANTFELQTVAGVNVNSTGYGAWSSGGKVEEYGGDANYPGAVLFTDDSRLGALGTDSKPETMYFSRSPSAAGAVRFDDYTTGTDASHAVIFTLAPLRGRVDSIRWATNTDKYIAVGTFSSVRRVYGETEQASIAPDAVTAKAANADGVAAAAPVVDGSVLFYINRSRLALEALEYDYQIDGYAPDDKNLISDHITTSGLKIIARTKGRPTLLWALRNDGVLLSLTYKAKENIAGWARHYIAGNGVVEWIGVMPRENNEDQLWMIVKRTINGNVVRYIEYFTDHPTFPDKMDFYSNESTEEGDMNRYSNYLYEVAKDAIHVDSSLSYDGSAYGTDAGASLVAGDHAHEEDSEDVVFTASAAVFTADMVGREIWGAYNSDGAGGGRARITEFVSSTVVKGFIVDEFWGENVEYAAGEWYITATELSGLHHLEGELVFVVADGSVLETDNQDEPTIVVENGSITISEPASKIHVGFRYKGILATLPIDQGGQNGSALNKTKIIAKAIIRLINSSIIKFGSSLYRLVEFIPSDGEIVTDRPVALHTGPGEVDYVDDNYEINKEVYIVQANPLPCTVGAIDVYMETSEE